MKAHSEKKFKAVRQKTLSTLLAFTALTSVLLLASCAAGNGPYRIEITGTLEEPGVVSYLGYTMNVYADQASNPCGDCAEQPVCLFVGDSEEAIARALAKALEQDFGNAEWMVSEQEGAFLVAQRTSGTSFSAPEPPSAPVGVSIKGGFGGDLRSAEEGGAAAVGSSGQVRNIKQFDGSHAEVPLAPEHLAAVYGPSYEALVALGAEELIVARADVQTESFPWASEVFERIDEIPVLEDVHAAVNVEQLLSYEPDLVYSFPRPNETALLDKVGVSWIAGGTTSTLEEAKELLYVFASGIGAQARERAGVYEQWFDERLALLKERTAGLNEEERPEVYYAGTDLLTTYGRDSDVIEVIEAAGGTAVTKELEGGNRINIDAEQLAALNPSWIFIDHCAMSGSEDSTAEEVAERAYENPRYSNIAAIAKRQVVLTPSGVFYWDMGLQKILLVEYMAKAIHPELFASLDMAAEVQSFYETIYNYPLTYEQAEKILARELP